MRPCLCRGTATPERDERSHGYPGIHPPLFDRWAQNFSFVLVSHRAQALVLDQSPDLDPHTVDAAARSPSRRGSWLLPVRLSDRRSPSRFVRLTSLIILPATRRPSRG